VAYTTMSGRHRTLVRERARYGGVLMLHHRYAPYE
jgi:hypothetical protein